jgi:predicted regulator of Ras-like GTPase activity (Roadblock/LC7/MglB family)
MSDLHAGSRSLRLGRALHDLLAQAPEIEAAAVVSFDGLAMASALPPSMDEDRVAAMSAALLSLGERAAQGLGRGELSQVYIEGDSGTVFLVSAENEAVLVAVAAKGAKTGLMLYEVRRTAAAVAETLRAEQPAAGFPATAEPLLQVVPPQPPAAYAAPAEPSVMPAYVPAVAEAQAWPSYPPPEPVPPAVDSRPWS